MEIVRSGRCWTVDGSGISLDCSNQNDDWHNCDSKFCTKTDTDTKTAQTATSAVIKPSGYAEEPEIMDNIFTNFSLHVYAFHMSSPPT